MRLLRHILPPLLPLALLVSLAAGCEKDSRAKGPTSPLARAVAAMPVPTTQAGIGMLGATRCRVEGGQVLCKGRNNWGQLGRGAGSADKPDEQPVRGITNATAVCVGMSHACSLHRGGGVRCWGNALSGQTGKQPPIPPPKGIPANHPTMLDLVPRPVPGTEDAVALACSSFFTCAATRGGTVLCWGQSPRSPSRAEAHLPKPIGGMPATTRIFAGSDFICGLTENREVHCAGSVIPPRPGRMIVTSKARLAFTVESPSDIRVSDVGICRIETRTQPAQCWGRPHAGYPEPPVNLTPP